MSEWIINRRPTEDDADDTGYVWVTTENGLVLRQRWDCIRERAWMPIDRPKPYVKPKRCLVLYHMDGSGLYKVTAKGRGVLACHIPTHEAAERIAAIYEEVIP